MKKVNYGYGTWGHALRNLPCSARQKAKKTLIKTKRYKLTGSCSFPASPVSCAFNWANTPQGTEYWMRIAKLNGEV